MRDELAPGLVGRHRSRRPDDRVPHELAEEVLCEVVLSEAFVVGSEAVLDVVRVRDDQLEPIRLEDTDARWNLLGVDVLQPLGEVGCVRLRHHAIDKLKDVANDGLRNGTHEGRTPHAILDAQVPLLEDAVVKQVQRQQFK